MTAEEIGEWVVKLAKESTELRKEAITLTWYMRGGLSYNDALHLSTEERHLINELINTNLETTKKSGLPFF
jgi:hypothetical protein